MPSAAVLLCLVIGISDGDTLTARCDTPQGPQNIKVRMAEIDAPEKAQPWGQRSKQHLAELCFKKPAEVRTQAVDRYGRAVARVACDGTDANSAQVRAGMAWVFDRYASDRHLYAVQNQAQEARRGLWADAEQVPPWEWRAIRFERRKTSGQ